LRCIDHRHLHVSLRAARSGFAPAVAWKASNWIERRSFTTVGGISEKIVQSIPTEEVMYAETTGQW
jgi:hypothetical protein